MYVRLSEDELQVTVTDKDSGYRLAMVLNRSPIDYPHCGFYAPGIIHDKVEQWVTARSLREYDPCIRSLEIDPALEYVDVGAGLGAFVPDLVRRGARPTIIDPVDYHRLQELLIFAQSLPLGEEMLQHIQELLSRCGIILDSGNVDLVTAKIEDALAMRQDLQGKADVVIDNAGANHYTRDGFERVWDCERKLLKPGGLLLSEVVTSGGIYRP